MLCLHALSRWFAFYSITGSCGLTCMLFGQVLADGLRTRLWSASGDGQGGGGQRFTDHGISAEGWLRARRSPVSPRLSDVG
jgi:hypothetical protein